MVRQQEIWISQSGPQVMVFQMPGIDNLNSGQNDNMLIQIFPMVYDAVWQIQSVT